MNPNDESASRLCKSCGICCQGLLHSHGVLDAAEIDEAASLGLELISGDEPAFALPCSCFEQRCTIYQDRPYACRGFRCSLLRQLDNKDIGLDDALAIVREARRLAAEAMPNASATELADEFREQRLASHNDSPGPGNKVERLKFIALGLYLDRHFVLPRDGNFYSIQPVAEGEK